MDAWLLRQPRYSYTEYRPASARRNAVRALLQFQRRLLADSRYVTYRADSLAARRAQLSDGRRRANRAKGVFDDWRVPNLAKDPRRVGLHLRPLRQMAFGRQPRAAAGIYLLGDNAAWRHA